MRDAGRVVGWRLAALAPSRPPSRPLLSPAWPRCPPRPSSTLRTAQETHFWPSRATARQSRPLHALSLSFTHSPPSDAYTRAAQTPSSASGTPPWAKTRSPHARPSQTRKLPLSLLQYVAILSLPSAPHLRPRLAARLLVVWKQGLRRQAI